MKNRKFRRWLVCSAAFVAVATLPFHVLARAQVSADSPFAGQRVHILVGTPPGGGHDIEARVFARHLGKHLPGNPSVIVQNMPEAGTALMITHVYKYLSRYFNCGFGAYKRISDRVEI